VFISLNSFLVSKTESLVTTQISQCTWTDQAWSTENKSPDFNFVKQEWRYETSWWENRTELVHEVSRRRDSWLHFGTV